MDKLTLIFVGGNSPIDNLIERVSKGDVSHVACLLFDSVFESTGIKEEQDPYPGIWLHNPHKYGTNPYAKFIQVEIPDKPALNKMARALLGTPYSYLACFKTWMYDRFRVKLFDTSATMHCSETITRLLRAGGVSVLPDLEPGSIDPYRLYKAVMNNYGGQDITHKLCQRRAG